MPSIKVKRGTRAQLNAAASASGLATGEPYLITDEGRLAVGTAAGEFVDFAKKSEVDAKQETLVSGVNIKTINGVSVLGSGNLITTGVPTGCVAYFAMSSAPTGWLKANGAAVSRTTYAALFAAIGTTYGAGDGSTTFNLPDLRGEFVRGLDDGRGVDSGRVIGSSQEDQNKSHNHGVGTLATASAGAHTHYCSTDAAGIYTSAQPMGGTSGSQNYTSTSSSGAHSHSITGSSAMDGGNESRPRNIALLACIKF